MRLGFHLTPFWSPTDRPPHQILDETIEVVAAASKMGFDWVSIGQHWISYPTVWPQPVPFLARIAPETGSMQLKTSVLLVPLLNPVDVAETIATLDHLCHGRLVLGVSVGYREQELDKTFAMYDTWRMQEAGMVPLQLDSRIGLDDWTIHGSSKDCVETLLHARDEYGLDAIGFTIYSLPRSPHARIEYLQQIAEEIVAPVKASPPAPVLA